MSEDLQLATDVIDACLAMNPHMVTEEPSSRVISDIRNMLSPQALVNTAQKEKLQSYLITIYTADHECIDSSFLCMQVVLQVVNFVHGCHTAHMLRMMDDDNRVAAVADAMRPCFEQRAPDPELSIIQDALDNMAAKLDTLTTAVENLTKKVDGPRDTRLWHEHPDRETPGSGFSG